MDEHEPECHADDGSMFCVCAVARAGYARGYREGYNDHARSRAHAEAIYGKYDSK